MLALFVPRDRQGGNIVVREAARGADARGYGRDTAPPPRYAQATPEKFGRASARARASGVVKNGISAERP